MAVKDSEELKSDERYPLGDYSFRIERSSVPGSSNDKIEAICTDKDGKNARKSIQVPSSTQLDGWRVEANETEATVYVLLSGNSDITSVKLSPIASAGALWDYGECGGYHYYMSNVGNVYLTQYNSKLYVATEINVPYISVFVTNGPGSSIGTNWSDVKPTFSQQMSADVYFSGVPTSSSNPDGKPYYNSSPVDGEFLVGRFAIEIEDAGGVGPGGGTGGGWTDPEDYDEDWEEGDPTHTLYVEVTGALSGRHNDPIVDPSYSYIPSDKDTVKEYGCGGDGGHGGGGGAGASTVVIHKFATNQANSKEVTAIARRHGYGSGGGKGGRGGDGCILIYY